MEYTDLSPGLTEAARRDLGEVFSETEMGSFLSRLTGGENPASPETLLPSVQNLFHREIRLQIGLLSAICAVIILFAVAERFSSSLSAKGTGKTVGLLLSGSVAALAAKGLMSALSVAREAVESMIYFTRYAGMCMAYLSVSAGAPASGSGMMAVLSVTLSVMGDLIDKAVFPLVTVGAAFGILHHAFSVLPLEGLAKLFFGSAKWVLGIFSTLFLALLGITGIAAGSLDGVGGKTVKFAVSSLVPVVGATLSEALDTVMGAALITKNAVGALGLIFLLGVSLLPLIRLGVTALLFRVSAAFSEMIAGKRCAGILSFAASAITLLFGTLAVLTALFAVSLALMIKFTDFGVSFR